MVLGCGQQESQMSDDEVERWDSTPWIESG